MAFGTGTGTHTDTITKLARALNSVNGNPSYWVTFQSGARLKTKKDAGFVYSISGSWEGKLVRVKAERGTIVDMELVEET